MGFLTPLEIAAMRADALGVLGDTCTVQTPTEAVDAYGSTSISWASTTNVACKLAPLSLRDQTSQAGAGYTAIANYALTLPFDQAISSGCRVVHESRTYEVIRVEDTHTWRAVRRAYLRRMDG
jgi:head-tail adaptor